MAPGVPLTRARRPAAAALCLLPGAVLGRVARGLGTTLGDQFIHHRGLVAARRGQLPELPLQPPQRGQARRRAQFPVLDGQAQLATIRDAELLALLLRDDEAARSVHLPRDGTHLAFPAINGRKLPSGITSVNGDRRPLTPSRLPRYREIILRMPCARHVQSARPGQGKK
jgi:hypothetical protein